MIFRIKLYDTWRKAKDIFVKPSLKCYFGRWSKDPCLPMWRGGPEVAILGWKKTRKCCYQVNASVMVHDGYSDWQGKKIKKYTWTNHKLPKGLHQWDWIWKPNIRKNLKRWHLGWLKPVYRLPQWLAFHIFNWDVMWKTKWDSIRFEFPPQFTIVFFGLSLSFWLKCPVVNDLACDDHYWEAILNHIYENKSGKLIETIDKCGVWRRLTDEEISYLSVRPEYIKKEKLDEYYIAVNELRKNYKNGEYIK